MRRQRARGITLLELIISISIMSLISAAAAALLHTALQAQAYAETRQSLHREAFQIMTRIARGLRDTTHPMLPNGIFSSRPLLVFSANVNADNDFYRGSPYLPRIDEDMAADMASDGVPGVEGIDDNGDLLVDLVLPADDDEDVLFDEDRWDGLDNDSDGSVDDDAGADMSGDGDPGISGLDDDFDGSVDEGNNADDDEDGVSNEDPVDPLLYAFNSGTKTLTEQDLSAGTSVVLSTQVSAFTATYEEGDASHGPRYLITLSLTANGETVTLTEYVFPRNLLQRTGRKLR